MTAILTNELTKEYGDTTALHSVNLTIEEGEIFGFLGPNGAGKSTLIDILLDFRRPTSGQVSVFGHDPQQEASTIRRRAGILPDGFDLYERLSGAQHIRFAAEMAETEVDPARVLSRIGLDSESDQPVGDYSKGMRQRLGLGMSLVGEPDLLILDEPVTGLDPRGIQRLQEIIKNEAERGTTVFFSSHLLHQVDAVCDRVGILNNGTLLAVDTVDALQETIGSTSVLVLTVDSTPDASTVEELEGLDGVTGVDVDGSILRIQCTNPGVKSEAIGLAGKQGLVVTDVDVQDRSLEDLFDAYTGDEQ